MKSFVALATLIFLLGSANAAPAPGELVQRHCAAYLPASAGVVAAVYEQGRRSFYSCGANGKAKLDENTLFEIGSVSKVFTGLLLADMVERGEVTLATRVGELLPDATPGIADVTLKELATHTSGLPRLPIAPATFWNVLVRRADPYRDTTVDALLTDLRQASVPRRGQAGYSNFGMAALGQLLARRAGKPYELLLRERVLAPVGLDDTFTAVADAPTARLAAGYADNHRATSHWHLGAYAPAGGLVSSPSDLLDFAVSQLDAASPASRLAQQRHSDLAGGSGLGFGFEMVKGTSILWHNGGTGGFASFLALAPQEKRAVVVLSNANVPVDAIGRGLLGDDVPLPKHETRWLLVILTLFFILKPPVDLLQTRRRPSVGLPPTKRHSSRLRVLVSLAEYALLYALATAFGAWETLSPLLLYGSLAITLTLLGSCLVLFEALPWRTDNSPWRMSALVVRGALATGLAVLFSL